MQTTTGQRTMLWLGGALLVFGIVPGGRARLAPSRK